MRKINDFLRKFLKKEIIPLLLLLVWLSLTLLYIFNYNLSPSVISYSHSKENIQNFSTNRIFKGEKITGEFLARENYLGIVTLSFTTFSQVAYADEDTLIFRIKDKAGKGWYYKNTYRSGSIFQVPFYPFGFPKISDSRGKTYQFEIESLNGNSSNAIALNSWEPVLVTRYQIPKSLLLENKTNLIKFFGRKIYVAFGNQEVIFFSFIYLLPLLFYLFLFTSPFRRFFLPIFQSFKKRFVEFSEKTFILRDFLKLLRYLRLLFREHLDKILISIVLINIFLIPALNDLALVVLTALWFYVLSHYGKSSKTSFIVGIFFLSLCPLILFFNHENTAEKASVWAFMFFLAGTIQIFKEQSH